MRKTAIVVVALLALGGAACSGKYKPDSASEPGATGDTGPAGETFNGEPVSGVLEPGTYDFFCRFHPSMTGTITVE